MADFRVELNESGVRELLQSGEMMGICRSLAEGVAARAGAGYEVTTYKGKTRVNASVHVVSDEARADNLKNNTLLKAVGK